MNNIKKIKNILKELALQSSEPQHVFFKTGPGHYSEHDRFLGVNVPSLRKIAKQFPELSFDDLQQLIESQYNEERFLALIILDLQYRNADAAQKNQIYQFYMKHLKHVNNWNLVDASAHLILGEHIAKKDKKILLTLAKSEIMWERRIAMVATWCFIRNGDLDWTFKIAKLLLKDDHDLIHKATGWMLREAGKRDEQKLIDFLDNNAQKMPRTMLRYAIEKFDEPLRKSYLT